jgi:hypothetical protein
MSGTAHRTAAVSTGSLGAGRAASLTSASRALVTWCALVTIFRVLPDSLTLPDILAFVVLPISLSVAFVAGVWFAWTRSGSRYAARATAVAAVCTIVWLGVSWEAAATGVLRRWNATPPPFALLLVIIVLMGLRLGFGSVGRRFAETIPLWLLVGVQGFRLPLELAMHRLAERGVMPGQMSYSGRNYDILTGATALLVALLIVAGKVGVRVLKLWNIVGLVLLVNIVTVAVLSTPRIAYFGSTNVNTFVTVAPFVWLPAIMVLAALVGHLVIFRALKRTR